MGDSHLEPEFAWYSEWLVEAAFDLAVPDRIPVACRGSGHPALLERLAGALGLRRGALVLDAGCGLGGPAAWLTRRWDCRVVAIDVLEAEVRAQARLFPETPCAAASCLNLPFRDGVFDAAWSLGVIELIPDKVAACRELARVLRPGGVLVVLAYAASRTRLGDLPRAGAFRTPDAYPSALAAAGLEVVAARPVPPLRPAPAEWIDSVAGLAAHVRRSHAADGRLATVEAELGKIRRLCSTSLRPWEMAARRPLIRGIGTPTR